MSSRTSRYFGQSKGMGAERADCGPRGRSARSPPHTQVAGSKGSDGRAEIGGAFHERFSALKS